LSKILLSLALLAQDHPGWYKTAILAILIAVSTYLLIRTTPPRIAPLVVMIFATLFVLRLPVLAVPELDNDESSIVSQAITWTYDPIYWRSVNSMTHGPVVSLSVLLGHVLGLPLTNMGARIVGLIQLTFMLSLFYFCAIQVVTPIAARLALLSWIVALGAMRWPNLVAFNAEHPAVLFLWLAVYLTIREYSRKDTRLSPFTSFLLGAVLGVVPFVKLQAIPIAGSIALAWMLILIDAYLRPEAKDNKKAWPPTVAFFIGGLLPTFAIVVTLAATGILSDSFDRYVIRNIAYANYRTLSLSQQLEGLSTIAQKFLFENWVMLLLTSICLWGTVIFVKESTQRTTWPKLWVFLWALTFAVASIYSVARTNFYFYHYAWFFFIPAALLTLPAFEAICTTPRNWRVPIVAFGSHWQALGPSIVVFAIFLLIGIEAIYGRFDPKGLTMEDDWPLAQVAKEVRRYSLDDDPIAVWGREPRLYVISQRRQGVLKAALDFDPEEPILFATQLRQSKAPVFVDCVGPGRLGYQDRASMGHENFRDLAHLIETQYRFINDLEGCRVYARAKK
jgi:hypothetical protein